MKRQTFLEYSKVICISLTISLLTAVFCIIQFYIEDVAVRTYSDNDKLNNVTIVIDAGHGGEDGGAVGTKGTLEKDINLAISKYLYDLFSITDVDVVMTRNGDYLLYEAGQESRKKFYDLNNRVQLCNSFENPVLLSIHQNKFPLEKYKGLQVYYSKNNDSSKLIADTVQNMTVGYLQKDNNRKTKEAGRNIFILDRIDCPAVLIECGFLSNSQEEALLNDCEYQKKIAFIIFSSVMNYFTQESFY